MSQATTLSWSAHPARYVTETDQDSVFTMRKGTLRCADGTEFRCFLTFCETDSNEHYGTGVLIAKDPESFNQETDLAWQDEEGFCKKLGKTEEQVFPYTYKYEGPTCYDHHIGDDGWSLNR